MRTELTRSSWVLAQAAPSCPDRSAFTPVLDRAAGLLAAIIGAGLLLNALRGAATYAHAHGDQSKIAHAKAIWRETGIGLAVAVLATPIIGIVLWVLGGAICGH